MLKTINQFLYFHFMEKYFKDFFLTKYFIHFSADKLISKIQPGFQPGDSCIDQLLSITHELFTSFDNGLEVKNVFLDISKAFDEV